MYRIILWLKKPSNTLWVLPTAGALIAVIFALAAKLVIFFLSSDLLPDIKIDIITNLLDVISNSMLAVSTFSLSIMVSAFSAASNSATPRATSLVMADDSTRITIASFISAFIYAIIAKIALGLDYYSQNGRFILFIATILVLLYVIIILIRWVHILSGLGRMGNTIDKIYQATRNSLASWIADPNFGANSDKPEQPANHHIKAKQTGYISHIHFAGLNQLASENQLHIHIHARPGHFAYLDEPLAAIYGNTTEELNAKIANCIIIEAGRSYQQDPRFGLIVMSEVAQRALSPAVNDPGTAITVINNLSTLLTDIIPITPKETYPQLSIISANYTDFIRQPFDPIARDGAGNYEIQIRLIKALAAIAEAHPELSAACAKQAYRALDYAEQLPLASDHDILARAVRRLFPQETNNQF